MQYTTHNSSNEKIKMMKINSINRSVFIIPSKVGRYMLLTLEAEGGCRAKLFTAK